MNRKRLSALMMAILITLGIIASQVGSASAFCLRNCPSEGNGRVTSTQATTGQPGLPGNPGPSGYSGE